MVIPKISIIIPIYNVEMFLAVCIESILSQTFNEFELILVDDGSPDSSRKICDDYAKKDKRIKVIHKKNGGHVSAVKAGLRCSNAEYIGFVDSDDWIDKEMFDNIYKKIIETDSDIVSTGYLTFDGDNEKFYSSNRDYFYENATSIQNELIPLFLKNHIINSNVIYPNSRGGKLFKRKLLIKNIDYYSEKLICGEDFAMNYINLLDAKKVFIIGNSCFYHYRQHASSIMHSYIKGMWDSNRLLILNIVKISNDKNYYCNELNMHLGALIYLSINYYASSNIRFTDKVVFIKKIINENPTIDSLSSYSKYVNISKKVYLLLIRFQMVKTIVLFKLMYDRIIGRH